MDVDLVIAGPVWTGTGPEQGLAVRDGRIVALGGAALALRATAGEVVDASGGLVLPAFRDGHVHPPQGGLEESRPAVREATTVEAVAAAVRDWADRHLEAEWVVAGSYDPALAPGGRFDARWLDAAVPDRPVVLQAADYHTVWCNTEALRRAGVDAATPDPPIGWIEHRDDGSPLGTLREWQACALVLDLVPPPSRAEREATLGRATQRLAAAGIVWVQDAWIDLGNGVLDAYLALAGRGELAVRAGLALRADPLRWRDQLAEFAAARLQVEAEGHGQVRIGTVKFFADGVVEGGTAALLDPYVDAATFDGHSRGMPVWDCPELAEAAAAVDALGLQLHVHAIGDAAVRAALDAVEHVAAVNGPRDRRPVIAHTQVVHPDDLSRFAVLGVVANFEPLWAQRDALMDDLTAPRLGDERTAWQYPMGSLLRSGARISFGSDWPVSSYLPLDGIRVAVTRTTFDGRPPGGWLPQERLSVEQALTAYTAGVAHQAFEDERGVLAVGSPADVVLLDRDVLTGPPETLHEARVLGTWLEGRATHRS